MGLKNSVPGNLAKYLVEMSNKLQVWLFLILVYQHIVGLMTENIFGMEGVASVNFVNNIKTIWKIYFVLSEQRTPDFRGNTMLNKTPAGVWPQKATVESLPQTLSHRRYLQDTVLLN